MPSTAQLATRQAQPAASRGGPHWRACTRRRCDNDWMRHVRSDSLPRWPARTGCLRVLVVGRDERTTGRGRLPSSVEAALRFDWAVAATPTVHTRVRTGSNGRGAPGHWRRPHCTADVVARWSHSTRDTRHTACAVVAIARTQTAAPAVLHARHSPSPSPILLLRRLRRPLTCLTIPKPPARAPPCRHVVRRVAAAGGGA